VVAAWSRDGERIAAGRRTVEAGPSPVYLEVG